MQRAARREHDSASLMMQPIVSVLPMMLLTSVLTTVQLAWSAARQRRPSALPGNAGPQRLLSALRVPARQLLRLSVLSMITVRPIGEWRIVPITQHILAAGGQLPKSLSRRLLLRNTRNSQNVCLRKKGLLAALLAGLRRKRALTQRTKAVLLERVVLLAKVVPLARPGEPLLLRTRATQRSSFPAIARRAWTCSAMAPSWPSRESLCLAR